MTHPYRILIVDDNTWMQRIVAKIISSYGWEPIVAGDGYEGIAAALEHQPDAVILDLIMPDLSGMQVLRLLKRLPYTAEIPVLILSVATEAELLMEAMRSGAAGFIRKPFTRSTLHEKITQVLSTPAPISQPQRPSEPQDAQQLAPPTPPSSPIDRYRQISTSAEEEQLRRWLDSL